MDEISSRLDSSILARREEKGSLSGNPVAYDPVQKDLSRLFLPVISLPALAVFFLVGFRSSESASKVEGTASLSVFTIEVNVSQVSLLARHVPHELFSEFSRISNTLRKTVHFVRSDVVSEVVVLHVVNCEVPVSSVVLISSGNVHGVHLVVQRDQMLTIHF
jgi:hypothetical protein